MLGARTWDQPGTAFQAGRKGWQFGSRSQEGIGKLMETLMAFPTDEQIRIRAHQLWEQEGKPDGREQEFWHQAEKELKEMDDLREIASEPPPTILPG
jgi:hypothetical protein